MTEPLPWTFLFNRIKSQVPSCDDAVIRQEVYNVVRDFTQDTNLFQETVNLNIVPNQLSYPVTFANGGTANRLMVVYKDGDPYMNWADSYITMRVPGTVQLFRSQPQAQLWHAIIAKAVSTAQLDNSTPPKPTGYPEIDSWIIQQFSDAIYFGTMWFLQRMPAKSFRDVAAAKENAAMYGSHKSQARVYGIRSNVYDAQNWRYPQSFRTITRKGWA